MTGIMELLEADGLHPKKVSIKEYHSPCPVCGGKDRFVVWPGDGETGRVWCRKCDLKVDGIGYLMKVHGMAFPEAAEKIGKPLHPHARRVKPKESRLDEPPKRSKLEPEKAEPNETWEPSSAWSDTAERFVSWAADNLKRNPERLEWFHRERGISPATADRWRIGWNPEPMKRPGKNWGLDGEELFFPVGLVIPNIRDGKPVSVKIRRESGEPKYHLLRGSRVYPYVLPGDVRGTVSIVEGELDALLMWETGRDVVLPIALGGCANKPDIETMELITCARVLLDCMDNDPAGEAAGAWWRDWFPDCSRWKPTRKDPGEMYKAGQSIRRWIFVVSGRRGRNGEYQ